MRQTSNDKLSFDKCSAVTCDRYSLGIPSSDTFDVRSLNSVLSLFAGNRNMRIILLSMTGARGSTRFCRSPVTDSEQRRKLLSVIGDRRVRRINAEMENILANAFSRPALSDKRTSEARGRMTRGVHARIVPHACLCFASCAVTSDPLMIDRGHTRATSR